MARLLQAHFSLKLEPDEAAPAISSQSLDGEMKMQEHGPSMCPFIPPSIHLSIHPMDGVLAEPACALDAFCPKDIRAMQRCKWVHVVCVHPIAKNQIQLSTGVDRNV